MLLEMGDIGKISQKDLDKSSVVSVYHLICHLKRLSQPLWDRLFQ